MRDPKKGVPGLFSEVAVAFGVVQEGSTLKEIGLTKLQACPKKL
jgi:hypothetical protein